MLLAGDAAHVHAPDGGQGLNTGVQDAVNLGWKLAQVVKGISSDSLLDSYHAQRHGVGVRMLRTPTAHVALCRADPRTDALRDIVAELAAMDGPRRRLAGQMPASISATISARGIRCWDAACPISISSRKAARCGCSACWTPRGRC